MEKRVFNNEEQLAFFLLTEQNDTREWGILYNARYIDSIKTVIYERNLPNEEELTEIAIKDFVKFIKEKGIEFPIEYESHYAGGDGYSCWFDVFYTPCGKMNYKLEIYKEYDNIKWYKHQIEESQKKIRKLEEMQKREKNT